MPDDEPLTAQRRSLFHREPKRFPKKLYPDTEQRERFIEQDRVERAKVAESRHVASLVTTQRT